MKFYAALAGLLLLTVSAFAADVDGKWTGTMATPMGDIPVGFTLKADGAKLTGTTMGPDGADVAIVEATGPGDVFSHMSWESASELKSRHPKTRFMFNHLYSGTVEDAVTDLQVVEV